MIFINRKYKLCNSSTNKMIKYLPSYIYIYNGRCVQCYCGFKFLTTILQRRIIVGSSVYLDFRRTTKKVLTAHRLLD